MVSDYTNFKSLNKSLKFLENLFFSVALQKDAHHSVGILHKGIFSPAKTPIIHKGSLHKGIGLGDFVDGKIISDLAFFLTFYHYFAEKAEVKSVAVQKVFFALGGELGGEKPRQKLYGDGGVHHGEKLPIEPMESMDGIGIGLHHLYKGFILFIEEGGKSSKQGIFALEIMIECTLAGFGLKDDIFNGGILIALFIKQLPRGRNYLSACVSCIFSGHITPPRL